MSFAIPYVLTYCDKLFCMTCFTFVPNSDGIDHLMKDKRPCLSMIHLVVGHTCIYQNLMMTKIPFLEI